MSVPLIITSPLSGRRSEEHTSELQYGYISYAVFCLKKKKIQDPVHIRRERAVVDNRRDSAPHSSMGRPQTDAGTYGVEELEDLGRGEEHHLDKLSFHI